MVENFGFRAPVDLTDTKTGQVTTALPGRTIYDINRERAAKLMPAPVEVKTRTQLSTLQTRLRKEIPALTEMLPAGQPVPAVTVGMSNVNDSFGISPQPYKVVSSMVFQSRSGIELPALLARSDKKTGHARLILSMDWKDESHLSPALEKVFREGNEKGETLLILHPLPFPASNDDNKPTFGATLPMTSRALLVGKTFVGMRADDVLAAVQYLVSLGATSVDAEADGPVAVALLHAAVLEPRITSITLHGSLSSYRSVLTAMPHRNVTETVVPGVLLHYDLDDLLIAMGSRPVTLIDPVDGGNQPLTSDAADKAFARVRSARSALYESPDGFKVVLAASGS